MAWLMPSTPAAGSAWPSHDFEDRRVKGAVEAEGEEAQKTAATAPTSMGSPRPVPAAWAERGGGGSSVGVSASWLA
jgi:hypothetical protein